MKPKALLSAVLAAGILSSAVLPADAHCWRGKHGRRHCDNGRHEGWYKGRKVYYDDRRDSWIDYRTGKIIKGGLIGAGLGAGAGYLLDRPMGKSAVLGGVIGAGIGAITD